VQAEIADATLRERLLLLRAMEALRPLDDSSLILLAEHARVRRFRAGDIVIAEDGPIDAVYLVTSGQITVTVSGKTIAVVGPGFGAGFAPLLARISTGVRAVADVATQTLEIAAEVLLDVYEQDFAFIRNVMRLQTRSILGVRDGLPADPEHPPAVDLGTWRDTERTLVERVLAIHTQPIFRGASLDAVIELVRSDVEVRYAAGDRIWAAGDPSMFALRVEYGRVRCTNPAGKSVDVGSGFVFGMLDCFAELPRGYEARAETPVIAYSSTVEPLLVVLEAHFDLAMSLVSTFARLRIEL
jgi:CRP-like cAMP-binding protein